MIISVDWYNFDHDIGLCLYGGIRFVEKKTMD